MAEEIISEDRMRAALRSPGRAPSHNTQAPRGRHRYAQDGEVPVSLINQRHRHSEETRAKLADLEHALSLEGKARLDAEKALQQAHEKISQLQMRLAHAESVRDAAAVVVPEPDPVIPSKKVRVKRATPALAGSEPVEWWMPGWRARLKVR